MQLSNSRSPLLLLIVALFVMWPTSAHGARKRRVHYPINSTISISCLRPALSPLPESPERQEHNGLVITVAPAVYSCQKRSTVTVRPVAPTFRQRLAAHIIVGNEGTPKVFVERTTRESLAVTPDKLLFRIHLTNQMPRVFRGAGAVVQFIVAGKTQGVEQRLYADFINALVPPRSEEEIEIYGPPIETLKNGATIGLLIYDVVTAVDSVGNATERSNFEWFFNVDLQQIDKIGAQSVSRGWRRN